MPQPGHQHKGGLAARASVRLALRVAFLGKRERDIERDGAVAMAGTGPSPALFTAFYELTMAQAYWQSGHSATATFSLTVRSCPPQRAYFVFAGLKDILEYLEGHHFSRADLDYLSSLRGFHPDFLTYLSSLRFTGSVRALQEGDVFFANEPVIEVTAPIIEAQLLENFLLNRVNLHCVLATKASRVVYAARGRPVVEFGSRRTPGLDAADVLARMCYLVGFSGTGNTQAAARHGIPPAGTMAHSFVSCFAREIDAFRAFGDAFPDESTFLVDTYDTLQGVKNALRVAGEMRQRGHELRAVRLDSGDLLDLAKRSRVLLDEAGFPQVHIIASGDLDEFAIEELLEAAAPIDGFGVGTRVGTSPDAPSTDCVYKLVEYDGRPVLKLSAGKETLPGRKQVYRYRGENGNYQRDLIALEDETPHGGAPLLRPIMHQGRSLAPFPTLEQARAHFVQEFAHLPDQHKRLRSPAIYPVHVSARLRQLHERIARQAKESATY